MHLVIFSLLNSKISSFRQLSIFLGKAAIISFCEALHSKFLFSLYLEPRQLFDSLIQLIEVFNFSFITENVSENKYEKVSTYFSSRSLNFCAVS